MRVNNSGRIVKTRKVKKGTDHQKNHRWESFTTKISKLNSLDPIRRVRRHDHDAEDLLSTTSYLRTGLEKWGELNMSESFIAFSQDVLPMSDSLAQILYHKDTIMEKFVIYMEKKERESMQPMLELITDFAHDLGPRFEKYYAKALEIITTIAAIPQDVDVIEWTFSSLAFMFKYLSKLLVSDLRPTYNLMAPLMGKHRQRPHIARFAAEAMSFLVKKAGAPAHRETSLPLIVEHVKTDLLSIRDTKEFGLYYHGIMTLFAEAMKGVGLNIHTSGPAIFESLVGALEAKDLASAQDSPWMNVIYGVLTSMVHHTSSDTFDDVLNTVVALANTAAQSFTETRSDDALCRLVLSARTIGIVAGVRKGTRVKAWPSLLDAMSNILKALAKQSPIRPSEQPYLWNSLILSVAILFQYAPMDSLFPIISLFIDSLTKEPLAYWFLPFCSYLSEADPERFRSIALRPFRTFVVAHWSDDDNGDTLSVLLPKMVLSGVIMSKHGDSGFALPQSWQDQIVSKFERLEVSPFPEQASPAVHDRSPATWHDRCLPKYNALLEVLASTIVHPSTNARIAEILLRKLKLALRPSSSLAPEEANFIAGHGFSAFCRMTRGASEVDITLEPLLRAAAPRYARLPNFLEALLDYETSLKMSPTQKATSPSKDEDSDVDGDLLLTSLISNLSTDSHDLRLLSLRLLDHIHTSEHGSSSEVLAIMIMVEQTPLDLTSSRSASMHIRKLAAIYASQPSGSWLKEAIPAFCFGMLTVKFAQIWEDASASLKQIAGTKAGEEVVAKLAFEWLEMPSMIWDGSNRKPEERANNGLTDFECSNLMKLDQLSKDSEAEVLKARDTMLQRFADAQQLVASQPPTARAQALRVLSEVPTIAERRSRQLVPMFLSWANKQGHEVDDSADVDGPAVSDWTRKDQKAQLELFARFTNPRSLFRSEEVFSALLQLLANGDIDTQKAALNAVLTWKDPNINPYKENLLNLLDEARFKEEIAILLQGQTLVEAEHRSGLMPILLRLLYGRSISRKGAGSGKQGMEATRLTILRNLGVEEIDGFLDIALGELKDIHPFEDGKLVESVFEREILNARKQVGLTHMIEGLLKELGTKVAPFTQKLADAILYCVVSASRRLESSFGEDEEEDSDSQGPKTSLLKVVRQTGIKCLILLFSNVPDFEWSPYIDGIQKEVITPRLDNLPIETAQGVSSILRLFYTWSLSPKLVLHLASNDQILCKVAECLAPPKSKDEVKLFALSIIRNIMKLANDESEVSNTAAIKTDLLAPNMDHFLSQIEGVLQSHTDLSKELLESSVETISELAPFVTNSTQARSLVSISIFLLNQPLRRVNPKTKARLLLVLKHFVPLYDLQDDPTLQEELYNTITSLFGFFKDKPSRQVLSEVLLVYSKKDPVIGDVAAICVDLNSFRAGRLDEPDYDRRLQAFNLINSNRSDSFTARQWTPLVWNMLYYIKQDEEHAILSQNSSDGICQFINAAGKSTEEHAVFMHLVSSILLPQLYLGVKEPSEIIRREYLKVMAHIVRTFPDWTEVNDMHNLLAGDDELESSFFNNILTTGKGRQSSALRQLAASAQNQELRAKNVSHFFIPLLEHFVFDRGEGQDADNLAAEARTTIGSLCSSLEWPQYRALLRKFIGHLSKPEPEKNIVKLLERVTEALAVAIDESASSYVTSDISVPTKSKCTLVATMPGQQKFADDLTANSLPPLMKYLHDKDESTVSLRVRVSIIIVKLLKLLPEEQLHAKLPAVLTDICHILRSKADESRKATRDTLAEICLLLGPSSVGFVLKELRGALKQGYQLHVLSYTMHSILEKIIPTTSPGDLDYCLSSIVAIIMDDIFGATGQEKDAEEYTSKMIEVKKNKSRDSMELISATATLSRLTDLVKPIQALLKEKLNLKMVRKIDELLNRISKGLLRNSAAQSQDSLVFCYEVIQDVYNSQKPQEKKKEDYRLKKYLIQKGAKKSGDNRGSTTVHTYKLVRFALDVLQTLVAKYDNLRTASNLAGWIPIIGDAVVQAEEEVKIGSFHLLATIVKTPLVTTTTPTTEGTNLFRVAATEASQAVLNSSSTGSDISQAGLKLISVILRSRQDVPIKDKVIDLMLEKIKDDLDEPERRHVAFNFVRAILDSKIQTAKVYEILDYVGKIMIQNPDQGTRDLARGSFAQFLREYPQAKKRWSDKLKFIADNLDYEQASGRLSTMELIHLLLPKLSPEYIQDISAACFTPLVELIVNDDEHGCKEAAGELIKEIFKRADQERMTGFLSYLRTWVARPDAAFLNYALQIWGIYYESGIANESDVLMLLNTIESTLATAAEESDSEDWEQTVEALNLALIFVQKLPDTLLSSKCKSLWQTCRKCVSFPNPKVRLSATRLMTAFYTDFARHNVDNGLKPLPLKGSGGLKLSADDTLDLIRRTAHTFKSPEFPTDLADEVVKNLVFLTRCAAANELVWRSVQSVDSDVDIEDDQDEEEESDKRSALQYLFERLSFILRKELKPLDLLPSIVPKTAALKLIQVLTAQLSTELLTPSLATILLPLSNITDAEIKNPYSMDENVKAAFAALESGSEEIMEGLKRKMGTKVYTETLLKVRQEVKGRRENRRGKRKIEAVREPERHGEVKRKKVERKKERRKERGQEHRDRRAEY